MWRNLLQRLENVNDNKKKWTTKDSFVVEKKKGKLKTYAMLIAIYIQFFKICCFFNQFIIVTNQKNFNFLVTSHVLIWHTINIKIIRLIYNNCDDYIQVFHLQATSPQAISTRTKSKIFFISIYDFGMPKICFCQKYHIWKLFPLLHH